MILIFSNYPHKRSNFKNGPSPASFSFFFVFSNKHYNFLQQIYVKQYPFNIWCWDSSPQPAGHESAPITTRPGLPPIKSLTFNQHFLDIFKVNDRVLSQYGISFHFFKWAKPGLFLFIFILFT